MKKLYSLLILFTSLGFTLRAQTYYPMLDSAANKWTYATQAFGVTQPPPGPRTSNCNLPLYMSGLSNPWEYTAGDTVINSVTYKILIYEENMTPCLIGFIREDTAARKVYFRSHQDPGEYVLYDFSLQAGNTFVVNVPANSVYQPGIYEVDSIVMVNIHAGPRRMFYLSDPANPFQPPLTWIESVGSPFELVYTQREAMSVPSPFGSCPGDQHQFSIFLACFEHTGNVYFDTCAYQVAQQFSGLVTLTDSCNYYYFSGSIDDQVMPAQLTCSRIPPTTPCCSRSSCSPRPRSKSTCSMFRAGARRNPFRSISCRRENRVSSFKRRSCRAGCISSSAVRAKEARAASWSSGDRLVS